MSIFGLRNVSFRGDEITCSCPFTENHRNGDRHPSFGINSESGLYHCFGAGTMVITRDGDRPIESLIGKKTDILNGNCEWEPVEFVDCGEQRLWDLTISRDGHVKHIYATAEHEWLVNKYARKIETQNLRHGMRLQSFNECKCKTQPSIEGLRHGFIYGDGSLISISKGGRFHHHVYAHVDRKAVFIKKYFVNAYEPSVEARQQPGYLCGVSITTDRNLKQLPSLSEDDSYLMGFIIGLFAADGNADTNRIFSVNADDMRVIRNILIKLNIPCTDVRSQVRTSDANMGVVCDGKEHIIYYVGLFNKLTPPYLYEYACCEQKYRNIYARTGWKVESVSKTNRIEHVYCCETSTMSFVLQDYIITGNCFGCGESGNIVQLAERLLNIDHTAAIRLAYPDMTIEEAIKAMRGEDYEPQYGVRTIDADIDYWANQDRSYWYSRGLNDNTIGKWRLGYDPRARRAVIPIYFKHQLVGWTKRRTNEAEQPKWQHSEGFMKSKVLFGMDESIGDACILVEAPLSAIKLDQYGIHNAVASFGCRLSNEQTILIRSNYNKVLMFYDPDDAGINGMLDAVEKLKDFVDVYVVMGHKDDPAALTEEEVKAVLGNVVPSWMVSGRR